MLDCFTFVLSTLETCIWSYLHWIWTIYIEGHVGLGHIGIHPDRGDHSEPFLLFGGDPSFMLKSYRVGWWYLGLRDHWILIKSGTEEWKNINKLDQGSIRSSQRYGLNTPYRLTKEQCWTVPPCSYLHGRPTLGPSCTEFSTLDHSE